mgnify:CR=1 FL=1
MVARLHRQDSAMKCAICEWPESLKSEDKMEKRLLSVKELSGYLSMPTATVYTMVSLKKLPGVVRLGRALRFEKAAIDEWVSGQAAPQANAQEHR